MDIGNIVYALASVTFLGAIALFTISYRRTKKAQEKIQN